MIRHYLFLVPLLILLAACGSEVPGTASPGNEGPVADRLRADLERQEVRIALSRTYEHEEVRRIASVPLALLYRWGLEMEFSIRPADLSVLSPAADSILIRVEQLTLGDSLHFTKREVEPAERSTEPAIAAFWAEEGVFTQRVNTDFILDAALRHGLRTQAAAELQKRAAAILASYEREAPRAVVVDIRGIELFEGQRIGFH